MNKRFLILLLVILTILGAVVGYYLRSGSLQKGGKAVVEKPSPNAFRIGSNSIYMADQLPGREVKVSFVSLEKDGFVVIHENKDGKPGQAIGVSSLLPAGETKNILPIALSRQVLHGETFWVALHGDDGDGTFDPFKDSFLTDTLNQPVMMQFMIDKEAQEPGEVNL